MAQIDVSLFSDFLPILSFFVAFVISFLVIKKTEIIKNTFFEVLVSFIFSIIFVSASAPRNFILAIVPWFAIIIVGVFLFMVLTGFVGKDVAFLHKGIGIVFVILLALVFIISGFFVFSSYFGPYLPGSSGGGGDPFILRITDWFYSSRVAGALLLLGLTAVVSWILIKAK